MPKVAVPNAGAVGVVKDLSAHEMPIGAWTDASNIRFLNGYASQFLGHGEVYGTPLGVPQFIMPVYVNSLRYWLYTTANGKQVVVTNTGGTTTHTDISHVVTRTGVVNRWSGFVFGGIPILNSGDFTYPPMYWDQSLAHKFVTLTNWPASTYCKVLRPYKNLLIALNISKNGNLYPFMVKWSSLAVPGALPSTYDPADINNDAGEFDIGEGQDPIIDGLGLRDSFIVYKESSTHALDFIGGTFVLKSRKVFGMSGLMNMNCAVEFDAFHFAVTGSDVVIHDGFTATSVLDKVARRFFFQDIDVQNRGLVHCYKNPFLNEIFVAYPSIGSTSCDKALVYNFADKTVSFRSLPNVNHAAYGPVDSSLGGNWGQDSDPWEADKTVWNGPDFTPDTARVLMASADGKLFLLDASASFNGVVPNAYMERRGLSFGAPERMKMIKAIYPRIYGNAGDTVTVKVGTAQTPYDDPVYTTMTYTIGQTLKCDCFVTGRYLSIWFGNGTAFQWRLDSYTIDIEDAGEF